MRRIKRVLCTVLAGALLAAVPGCADQTAEMAAPQEALQEAPMEISLAFWNVADYLNGDALQCYVEDKFHIEFVPVNINYDDYAQQLQQLAASDNLPDIFANDLQGTSTYGDWVEQGKIRSIPQDLSAYPNLQAYLAQDYNQQFVRADGKFYMIPRLTYSSEDMWALDRCIMVRRDWMEHLGLSVPQSWDDFTQILSAFVNDDPDGNGVADTQGLLTSHLNTLEALYLNSFPELSNTERGWMYEDGQWMPVYASARTGPALAQVQALYRQGLLAPNFAYTSTNEAIDAFANGRVGAITAQYYGVVNYMIDLGMRDEVADVIQILPTWPVEDGSTYRFTTSLHWSESYFGANVDSAKLQRICELYNWLLSDEFALICEYGLEGTDWDRVNGAPTLRDEGALAPNLAYPSLNVLDRLVKWNQETQYTTTPVNVRRYGKSTIENAAAMLDWFKSKTKRVDYNFDIIFMSVPSKNSLVYNREVQDEMVKVIMGAEDATTAWPKVLERLEESTTLADAIRDVTAQAQAEGITP